MSVSKRGFKYCVTAVNKYLAMLPMLSPENSTIPLLVSSGNGHLIGRHLTADSSTPPLLPGVTITLEMSCRYCNIGKTQTHPLLHACTVTQHTHRYTYIDEDTHTHTHIHTHRYTYIDEDKQTTHIHRRRQTNNTHTDTHT